MQVVLVKDREWNLPEFLPGEYRLCYALRGRKGAGLNHDVTKILPEGSLISVTRIRTLSVSVWGKAKEGWFCLYMSRTPYVKRIKKCSEPD